MSFVVRWLIAQMAIAAFAYIVMWAMGLVK
jgi:hypothetical protein